MSVEYNEFVLSTAYWEGFITEARYNASKKALQQHPELLALDLIRHQNWLQPEQLEKLEAALAEAIAKAEAAAAATAVPSPQPRMAAMPAGPKIAGQPSVATPRPVVAQPTPHAVPTPRPAVAQPSVAQPSVPTAHAVPTARPVVAQPAVAQPSVGPAPVPTPRPAVAQPALPTAATPVPTPRPAVAQPALPSTPQAVPTAHAVPTPRPAVAQPPGPGPAPRPAAAPQLAPAPVASQPLSVHTHNADSLRAHIETGGEGVSVLDYLKFALDAGASDIHLGVGAPPQMRRHGSLVPLYPSAPELTAPDTERLWKSFVLPLQKESLLKTMSSEFSYAHEKLGRFRVSVTHQRKGWSIVFRAVSTRIRTMEELGLPEVAKLFTQYHNGLVLITGSVGSGKSTTLAAMVQEINMERHDHIITLEDPIEYVFEPAGCQITQREVHTHTMSFGAALRASLREDPDVIVVGEMRDLETISLAITAAETGHLVLATLHTGSAARTLDRILDAFPVEQQGQIRTMVSESLRGIISQQLVPRVDGKGRALALEILVNNPAVGNLIRDSKTYMLPGQIQIGRKLGMRMMDDSLLELVESGVIAGGEAYDRADQKKLFDKYV